MNLENVILEKRTAYKEFVFEVASELMDKFNILNIPNINGEYTMTEHQVLTAVLLHCDINIQYTKSVIILEFWKDVRKYVCENYTK